MARTERDPVPEESLKYIEIQVWVEATLQKEFGMSSLMQIYIYCIKNDFFRFLGLKNET